MEILNENNIMTPYEKTINGRIHDIEAIDRTLG